MSTPAAGWYPDPGGQSGMYRYWSGTTWSAALSADPNAAAPAGMLGQGSAGYEPSGYRQGTIGGSAGYVPGGYTAPAKRKQPVAAWVLLGVGVVVIALVAWLVVRFVATGSVTGGGSQPGGAPSTQVCPTYRVQGTPPAHPNDGRVYGGAISYPQLGSPWSAPSSDDRVPFGYDVRTQTITIEPNYNRQGSSWVASVLVGQLVAGDGFYSPKEGSEIVMKCVLGRFYGDAQVGRQDKVNQAMTVDGHEAWIIESQLSFSIPNLKAKGELAIVVVIDTGAESSSLYYASIPDNARQYEADARRVLTQLKVAS